MPSYTSGNNTRSKRRRRDNAHGFRVLSGRVPEGMEEGSVEIKAVPAFQGVCPFTDRGFNGPRYHVNKFFHAGFVLFILCAASA